MTYSVVILRSYFFSVFVSYLFISSAVTNNPLETIVWVDNKAHYVLFFEWTILNDLEVFPIAFNHPSLISIILDCCRLLKLWILISTLIMNGWLNALLLTFILPSLHKSRLHKFMIWDTSYFMMFDTALPFQRVQTYETGY